MEPRAVEIHEPHLFLEHVRARHTGLAMPSSTSHPSSRTSSRWPSSRHLAPQARRPEHQRNGVFHHGIVFPLGLTLIWTKRGIFLALLAGLRRRGERRAKDLRCFSFPILSGILTVPPSTTVIIARRHRCRVTTPRGRSGTRYLLKGLSSRKAFR